MYTRVLSWLLGTSFVAAALSVGARAAAAAVGPAVAASGKPSGSSWQPGCVGVGKAAVDWWVMLKHPYGYQYSYLDARSVQQLGSASCQEGACWRHGLTMQNPNPVSHTLAFMQPASAASGPAAGEYAYAMYNDADPTGVEHFTYAHAKGVVAFSGASGFWLVHSAPRFPQAPTAANFSQLAHPQTYFAQHFFCFSFKSSAAVPAVAQLLSAAGPYVYAQELPPQLGMQFPDWARFVFGVNDTQQHAVNASISSSAGQQLLGFAKTAALISSLEDEVIPVGLGSSMLWETWRRGHDALPSLCPPVVPFSSLNIMRLAFPGSSVNWAWSQDHSKWGVSSRSGGRHYVCLGDMNRAAWQAHRGGGYVCLQHQQLWEAFHGLVASVQGCSRAAEAVAVSQQH